jgi:hypothetical protein
MSISYYLGNKYYPIPYDLKKMGLSLAIHTFFSAVSFYGFREILCGIGLLIVFLYFIYHNEKVTLMKIIKG